jgi:hypothetical protein
MLETLTATMFPPVSYISVGIVYLRTPAAAATPASLGIQSVRNGFGSGEWLWRLERQPTPVAPEPLLVVAPRIPSSWIEGVARLDYHRPPTDIPAHGWHQFWVTATISWPSAKLGGARHCVKVGIGMIAFLLLLCPSCSQSNHPTRNDFIGIALI